MVMNKGVFVEAYLYLFIAIAGEVIGTSALKASYGMSKLWPSLIVIIGYSVTFWSLSISLKTLPVGTVYAIWSGLGIVSIFIIGVYFYHEEFTLLHLLGMCLIITGIVLLMMLASPIKE